MTSKFGSMGVMTAAFLMVVALAGCKSSDPPITTSIPQNTGNTGGGGENTNNRENLPEFDEDWLFTDAGLETIYFDYDSSTLRDDALDALARNADNIKKVPSAVIQVEGHCDERGTQEYNLALGERRALATRQHLINLGVSGDRIITISYGEENPAALGHNEDAWGQNRRCAFNKAM